MDSSRKNGSGIARWELRLFGLPGLLRDGEPAILRTKKTLGLLGYLAFYVGKPIARNTLIEAYWPEASDEAGSQSLRTSLWSLRSLLEGRNNPESVIRAQGDSVTLVEGSLWIDTQEFLELWDCAHAKGVSPEQATTSLSSLVSLYSGQLMEGFDQPWICPQLFNLEDMFIRAVDELVTYYAEAGKFSESITIATQSLSKCSVREDLYISLIKAYGHAGKQSEALRVFESLETMLDNEWGEAPSEAAILALDSAVRGTRRFSRAKPVLSTPETDRIPRDTRGFYGRDREVAAIAALLDPCTAQTRCLTLTGIGGAGKTRLAKAALRKMDASYGKQCWFVALEGIDDAENLPEVVGSIICTNKMSKQEPLAAIARVFGDHPALIVLDNLEHLFPSVMRQVSELLTACPSLRIIATSRVPLEIPEERIWPVGPLDLPSSSLDLAAINASPSVQMLVDRAQASRPGFAVNSSNAYRVRELCIKLEGLPLAIELVAPMLGTMTPSQVLAAIGQSIDLSDAFALRVERQRSLRAVVQWSFSRLDEEAKQVLAMLGVCRGGFTQGLAESVAGRSLGGTLGNLCKASLIKWEESNGELRFEMLDTIREFAKERLDEYTAARSEALMGHFQYLLRLVSGVRREEGMVQRDPLAQIDLERENAVEALRTASSGLVPSDQAWALAFALEPYIFARGQFALWANELKLLMSSTGDELSLPLQAKAHMYVGEVLYGVRAISDYEHQILLAIEAADAHGDPVLQAETRCALARPAILKGKKSLILQELETARRFLGDQEAYDIRAEIEIKTGWSIYAMVTDMDPELPFRRALDYAVRSGNEEKILSAKIGLACAIGESQFAESCRLFDEVYLACAGVPGSETEAHATYNQGLVCYRNGRWDQAHDLIRRSLRLFNLRGTRLGQTPLTIAGLILSAVERYEAAATVWGRAESARKRDGMKLLPSLASSYSIEMERSRTALGDEEFFRVFVAGGTRSDDEICGLLCESAPAQALFDS